MPININATLGDYNYTYIDGPSLKVPQLVAKPRKSFPFKLDKSVYTLEEDYLVLIDYYQSLKPGQRHPKYPNLFFSVDSEITDIGSGVGKFSRTWSMLPGMNNDGKKFSYTRSEYESFAYQVPGFISSQTQFTQFPVTSATLSNGKHTIAIGTKAPYTFDAAVGKAVTVFYTVRDPISVYTFYRQAIRTALTGTNSTTLVVDEIKDINSVSIYGAQRADINTQGYTKTIMSRVDYDYFLPNVNVDSVDAIPIINIFSIYENATGNYVTQLSDTTTPSMTEFMTMVSNKQWLCVEASTLSLWNGAIFERKTRYARADTML